MQHIKTTDNVGKAKYVVTFYDGISVHPDGSPFHDIAIFKNKVKRDAFIANLKDAKPEEYRVDRALNELYALTELEYEDVSLSEAQSSRYMALVNWLNDNEIDIPFGINY